MRTFLLYFLSLVVGAIAAYLINVLSANNDHTTLSKQLTSPQGIWISVIAIVVCLVIGALIQMLISRSQSPSTPTGNPEKMTTMRNTWSIFSSNEVVGPGSNLDNVKTLGSKNKVKKK
jgi:hypothetical protein